MFCKELCDGGEVLELSEAHAGLMDKRLSGFTRTSHFTPAWPRIRLEWVSAQLGR